MLDMIISGFVLYCVLTTILKLVVETYKESKDRKLNMTQFALSLIVVFGGITVISVILGFILTFFN